MRIPPAEARFLSYARQKIDPSVAGAINMPQNEQTYALPFRWPHTTIRQ